MNKGVKKLIRKGWALREDKSSKLRYDLIPLEQLKRLAEHYTSWAVVHWDRNRESWTMEYAEWCRQSAYRHFLQWMNNETDEEHDMACIWNIIAYEHLLLKNK